VCLCVSSVCTFFTGRKRLWRYFEGQRDGGGGGAAAASSVGKSQCARQALHVVLGPDPASLSPSGPASSGSPRARSRTEP
jgi:hypothetical protein